MISVNIVLRECYDNIDKIDKIGEIEHPNFANVANVANVALSDEHGEIGKSGARRIRLPASSVLDRIPGRTDYPLKPGHMGKTRLICRVIDDSDAGPKSHLIDYKRVDSEAL